jgi:hypothetical protein
MKKNTRKLLGMFLLPAVLLSLNSCIGVSMDIQMRKDGSGRISVEYRFSRALESLGKLDGNEDWPPIPVGREDLERSIERIDGIRLSSFSTSEDRKDVIFKYTLDYDNTEALLKYIDPSGNKVSLITENQSGRFNFILNERPASGYDQNVLDMMKVMFDGYNFALSFSAEGNSTLTLTDGAGNAISPPDAVEIVPSGRRVSFSTGLMEVVSFTNGFGVNISW